MPKKEYHKNQKVGVCIFIKNMPDRNYGQYRVRAAKFECPVCKKHFVGSINSVQQMQTKSCGCNRFSGESSVTHGMSKSSEYGVWGRMLHRCDKESCKNYHNYGGRGISVCKRWRKFENFIADMGRKPSSKHSLDRYPDKNGNYEPTNCRWATSKEQNNNRRNNLMITYNGETKNLKQWSESLNIKYVTLKRRYYHKWPTNEMLNSPVRGTEQFIKQKN